MKNRLFLFCSILSFSTMSAGEAVVSAENYSFDETLLKGSGLPIDEVIDYTSQDKIKPGRYPMDIKLNGLYLFNSTILFKKQGENSEPCFSKAQLTEVQLKDKKLVASIERCVFLGSILPQASVETDFRTQSIDLIIPDVDLLKLPKGYVSPDRLTAGETMLMTNYSLNQYYSHFNNTPLNNYQSTWISLNSGINIGLWQLRNQGSWSHNNLGVSRWVTNRSYLQRPIVTLKSHLTLGDSYSSGSLFSGLAFRGAVLKSDDRMLPQSERGYAPVVRGIANSNAKVTVRQGKNILYEGTVSPGNFEIRDLNPLSYSGDLIVSVTEADGAVNTFSVPYAALPESLRPGSIKYSVTAGQIRYVGDDDLFGELTAQYGVNNRITANLGTRGAKGYIAGVVGAVYATPIGAFGINSTVSRDHLPNSDQTGWMFHANYSKRINQTNTTLALAGYRYSTAGYRDLSDYVALRKAQEHNRTWTSSTLNQSSRLEASITQDIEEWGNVWLSGSLQTYRDGRGKDKQYQLGYSKLFANGVTLNASIARTHYSNLSWDSSNNNDSYMYDTRYYTSDRQTLSSLTISIPFGDNHNNMLSTSFNKIDNSSPSLQSTLSGTLNSHHPISYGLTYMRDDKHNQSVGLTGQTSTDVGSLQGSVSVGKNYYQSSAGMQGALVIHRDGITVGPYLGDTFALIEAKGAKGAKVEGVSDATVDRFGFALSPAVAPYQYNNISLDSTNIDNYSEITSGSQRVAPYAGAMVRVIFSVQHGYPILMTINSDMKIPMGATVYNQADMPIGTVGQGNQAWLRNDKLKDVVIIKWGRNKQCHLTYDINNQDKDAELISAHGECHE